jgi:steroid delta-isomerase-like uncharacterized protein
LNSLKPAQKYFDAWNARDSKTIVQTFAPVGTYRDPTTEALSGDAIGAYAEGLWAAFPDLSFEISNLGEMSPGRVAAQWIMRGTNSGSLAGLPPTGRAVVAYGADFVEVNSDGLLQSVTGYFDSRAVPDQLGLQVIVQPHRMGPVSFGTSVAVQSGKRVQPGAFGITELRALSATQAERVTDLSRRIVAQIAEKPGFIGWVGVQIGERMMTITAWESADDLQQTMSSGIHREAIDEFMKGEMASGGITSVWVPGQMNARLVRCSQCARVVNYDKNGGACRCGATLPQPQPYW